MNEKEIAYREGYAKGYQDAKKEERHGRWIIGTGENALLRGYRMCPVCSETFKTQYSLFGVFNYCHFCGAIMDLPNITEQTENALRKLGEHREEVDFDYNAED